MKKTSLVLCVGFSLALILSCTKGGEPLGGGLPVIEPVVPVWNDLMDEFLMFAEVTTAAGSEEISDAVHVQVALQWLHPEGQDGPIQVLSATKVEGNPKMFQADATELDPLPAQQIRFWWAAEQTMDDGTLLELAKTDPQVFQVDCTDGPDPDLAQMHAAVQQSFSGPLTLDQIGDRGYILNNHGFPAINGLGVSFIRFPPVNTMDLVNPAAFLHGS